jgi:predicted house-cleaning noncanonical NTP pyrophosphatase (MazG superfamily)
VDFLYEAESTTRGASSSGPGSFRLLRPVELPTEGEPIELASGSRSSIDQGLRTVAAWLASHNIRAHVEWVAGSGRLHVVQLDIEDLPPKIRPMSEFLPPPPRSVLAPGWSGACFRPIGGGPEFSALRKTRSHALLHAAGAFVPPIFVALDVGAMLQCIDGPLWNDLRALLCSPVIIRFDVPLARAEWTNLPTVGPVDSIEDARPRIAAAVQSVLERGIVLDEVSVVVHHFIAARASAWSEFLPGTTLVRVDATWGLPDGLQAFVHDSFLVDTASGSITPQVRYKDRFFDVGPDGRWITRRAYPALARDPACNEGVAREIARITTEVAQNTGRATRVMWFLDVVQGAGTAHPAAMPWIVVEMESASDLSPPWFRAQSNPLPLRRLTDLHATKAVRNRRTLARLQGRPGVMDLGGRHVLLEPDASVVRDRQFLREFVDVIRGLPDRWTVVYSGSMLAHTPYQLEQMGIPVLPLHEEVQPPRRTYQRKLVRDGIPAKIEGRGEQAEVVELDADQYLLALRQKLVEEALEVAYAGERDEIREELADLLAVARAIASASGIAEWEEVEEEEQEKRARRGGFDARLYLRATGFESRGDRSRPGGVTVARLRRKDGVRVPLVPPLLALDRESSFHFPRLGVVVTVGFREQQVDVVLRSSADRLGGESRQLSLFESDE